MNANPVVASIVLFVLLGSFPGLARVIGDEALKMMSNTLLENPKYFIVAVRAKSTVDKCPQEPDVLIHTAMKAVEEELAAV